MWRALLLSAVAAASGCYRTQAVRGDVFSSLRAGLAEDDTVVDAEGNPNTGFCCGGVRIDPNSNLRLHRTDGSTTPWFNAAALKVSDDGLFVSTRTVPWEQVDFISVSGVSAAAQERLRLVAPDGSRVEVLEGDAVRLYSESGAWRTWLSAYLEASEQAHAPAEGRFSPNAHGVGRTPGLDASELPRALDGPLVIADGIRWLDLASVEVNNLDGALTFAVVMIVPLSIVAGQIPVGIGYSSSRSEVNGVQPVEVRAEVGRVLGRSDIVGPRVDNARPFFSEWALRRSRWRGVVWTSATSELTSLTQAAATLGGGGRYRDVLELGLMASAYWRAPLSPDGRLPGPPLLPGPSAQVPVGVALARVMFDFSVDEGRRISLPLGADTGAALDGTFQLRVRYGVRVRPWSGYVLGLYPFNAQYTALPRNQDPGAPSVTFPWGIEAMHEF